MLEKLREFLRSGAGKAVAAGFVLIGLIIAVMSLRGVTSSEGERASRDRMFVDSTTMKPFAHEVSPGEAIPVKAPSGKATGFPADACFWTKDGKTKTDPTWVLVNEWIGKSEPTFCPDCGRLVVAHNPAPAPGANPPPTKEEYMKNPRRGSAERR